MRHLMILGSLLALLMAVPAAAAEPGALPFQELNLFPRDKLSVEINLEGPLLHMVAEATRGDDPEFSKLMAGLQAIRVQVFPVKDNGGVEPLRPKIERALHWLEDRGWQSTVRVRDKDGETYIYVKSADRRIIGLTVLALDPKEEAALINIVGSLDPAQIGRLGRSLDIKQLQKIPTGGKP
jgi:hypothetical protein